MAKTKIRYRTRARKYAKGRASKAGLKGMVKPVMAGVLTGVIQSFIPNDALGGYGDTLVPLGIGYFMNDKTLMTLGAYQLGIKLSQGFGATQGSVGFQGQA